VQITQIRPADFAQWAASQAKQPLLLDVREAWELQLARVNPENVEVVHIPMGKIPVSLDRLDLHDPLAILCHHGVRSMHVARFLVEQGYTCVINITGGIDAWAAQVDNRVGVY
jgi:rhodanese-related sulfurtransferase